MFVSEKGDGKRFEAIWGTIAAIPEGRVATYGQIGRLCGLGRGARLVGYALRAAPDRLHLPWHRVINAQGRISFPKRSRSYELQKRLLEEEGVVMLNGQFDLDRFRWTPTLDELLWNPGNQAEERSRR